ncbi:MAG: peptide-methionine (S)-S-oxide reductase MsrA, partial [Candidatus Mariimomonas ferrooxydans]
MLFILLLMQSGSSADAKLEKATVAGGCFWCMEPPFEKLDSVKEVISGYTGGTGENPTYKEVSSGRTGHAEAVEIIYDSSKITYSEILDIFWRQIDPTDPDGQFADRGSQYRTAIFYHSEEQRKVAEKSKEELSKSGIFQKPVITEITPAAPFYRAEEYHQDYYKKNPIRYKIYRYNSGRDKYLKKKWSGQKKTEKSKGEDKKYMKPSKEEIMKKLTPLQYKVTQEDGTERAYDN